MSLSVLLSAVPAALLLSSEEGEHGGAFLGISLTVWQALNLVLFLAVLIYFVARPMGTAFRKRQDEIEARRKEVDKQRAHVDHLSTEIRERTAKLEKDIEEIRRQAVAEGQSARAELAARAEEESARTRKDAQEEIDRRLAEAKAELQQSAAALTAQRASELLSREITDDDRRRLLEDSVKRMGQASR